MGNAPWIGRMRRPRLCEPACRRESRTSARLRIAAATEGENPANCFKGDLDTLEEDTGPGPLLDSSPLVQEANALQPQRFKDFEVHRIVHGRTSATRGC